MHDNERGRWRLRRVAVRNCSDYIFAICAGSLDAIVNYHALERMHLFFRRAALGVRAGTLQLSYLAFVALRAIAVTSGKPVLAFMPRRHVRARI